MVFLSRNLIYLLDEAINTGEEFDTKDALMKCLMINVDYHNKIKETIATIGKMMQESGNKNKELDENNVKIKDDKDYVEKNKSPQENKVMSAVQGTERGHSSDNTGERGRRERIVRE